MELLGLSAREIAAGVKAKKFTAEEAVRASIERIKRYDKKYNAIVALCEEEAVASAKRVDEAVARGEEPGALCGVPYVVKDNFCTKGIVTTCCSKMLKGWVSNYDATAVEKMKEAGAVLIGKANMDEFAMGSTTESSIFGATLNPRDRTRVPGGSSGGSAAAVAAGYVPVALGSDTGGSVRQPAAFCGVQGMKPSYGQISRYGIVAYASSLDQVGPLAANVGDLALLMDVLAKGDPNDTTCDAYERPSFTGAAAKAFGDASSKPACYDGMRYGHHADGRNLSEMYKKSRMEGFGEEVRKRILVGTCILTRGYYENYFVPAMKVRQLISDEFKNLFEEADMLICPISPALAYKRGLGEKDPVRMYLGDVFTTIANLAGLPSVSLNLGFTAEGLPTNVQLLAPRFGDDGLLCCAAAIERAAGAPHIAELTEDD